MQRIFVCAAPVSLTPRRREASGDLQERACPRFGLSVDEYLVRSDAIAGKRAPTGFAFLR